VGVEGNRTYRLSTVVETSPNKRMLRWLSGNARRTRTHVLFIAPDYSTRPCLLIACRTVAPAAMGQDPLDLIWRGGLCRCCTSCEERVSFSHTGEWRSTEDNGPWWFVDIQIDRSYGAFPSVLTRGRESGRGTTLPKQIFKIFWGMGLLDFKKIIQSMSIRDNCAVHCTTLPQ
jgi:hypothetical protein